MKLLLIIKRESELSPRSELIIFLALLRKAKKNKKIIIFVTVEQFHAGSTATMWLCTNQFFLSYFVFSFFCVRFIPFVTVASSFAPFYPFSICGWVLFSQLIYTSVDFKFSNGLNVYMVSVHVSMRARALCNSVAAREYVSVY